MRQNGYNLTFHKSSAEWPSELTLSENGQLSGVFNSYRKPVKTGITVIYSDSEQNTSSAFIGINIILLKEWNITAKKNQRTMQENGVLSKGERLEFTRKIKI